MHVYANSYVTMFVVFEMELAEGTGLAACRNKYWILYMFLRVAGYLTYEHENSHCIS